MLVNSGKTRDKSAQLTTEQRLAALETNVAGLRETTDRLYKMLKEQGELISEYITKQLVASDSEGRQAGVSAEDALFTFVCRRKFDHIEKELGRLRRLLAGSSSVRRVG
jgi:hypothetical protein